jgi:hypothetical protein
MAAFLATPLEPEALGQSHQLLEAKTGGTRPRSIQQLPAAGR